MGVGVYRDPQSKVGNMCSPVFSCEIPSQNFSWFPERFAQGKTGRLYPEIRGGDGILGDGFPRESLNSSRRLIAGGPEHTFLSTD